MTRKCETLKDRTSTFVKDSSAVKDFKRLKRHIQNGWEVVRANPSTKKWGGGVSVILERLRR